MKVLCQKYPNDWKAARKEMAFRYYYQKPEATRTIWNANLNGVCSTLALLYGEGDFQKTLDFAWALGFVADSQAASMAGVIALMKGTKAILKELLYPAKEWQLPFNDFYKTRTR